jgi:hypothetical protein
MLNKLRQDRFKVRTSQEVNVSIPTHIIRYGHIVNFYQISNILGSVSFNKR